MRQKWDRQTQVPQLTNTNLMLPVTQCGGGVNCTRKSTFSPSQVHSVFTRRSLWKCGQQLSILACTGVVRGTALTRWKVRGWCGQMTGMHRRNYRATSIRIQQLPHECHRSQLLPIRAAVLPFCPVDIFVLLLCHIHWYSAFCVVNKIWFQWFGLTRVLLRNEVSIVWNANELQV